MSNYIIDKVGNTLCLDPFLSTKQCSNGHTTTTNPYLVLADTRPRRAGGRNVLTPKCPRPQPVHGRPVYYPKGKPRWSSSILDGEEIAQVVPLATSETPSDENGNIIISPTVSQTQNIKTQDFTNYPESAEGILSNDFTKRSMKRKPNDELTR